MPPQAAACGHPILLSPQASTTVGRLLAAYPAEFTLKAQCPTAKRYTPEPQTKNEANADKENSKLQKGGKKQF